MSGHSELAIIGAGFGGIGMNSLGRRFHAEAAECFVVAAGCEFAAGADVEMAAR